MAAFDGINDLINRMSGGNSGTPKQIGFSKDARVGSSAAAATVAARYTTLWQYNGQPSHGAAPGGTVRIPDNTTAGSLLQADPGGGREQWLLGAEGFASAPGVLVLYDRLLDISGFSGTVTTAQTVGGTITRNTGGVGNEIWIDVYTQIGTTGTTATANYTDNAGNSGQTSTAVAIGGTGLREAQRSIPLMLASGDTGAQAVASVTLAATTGTAGDFGVTIRRRLLELSVPASGLLCARSLIREVPSLIKVDAGACLEWIWFAQGTTAPAIGGLLAMVER